MLWRLTEAATAEVALRANAATAVEVRIMKIVLGIPGDDSTRLLDRAKGRSCNEVVEEWFVDTRMSGGSSTRTKIRKS